jgi:hypothetical protein
MEIPEPTSNSKSSRSLQGVKQDLEIVSIDEGRQIDQSEEQWSKADSPRFESREPGSKVKCSRFRQDRKHSWAIVSTEEGMQID